MSTNGQVTKYKPKKKEKRREKKRERERERARAKDGKPEETTFKRE